MMSGPERSTNLEQRVQRLLAQLGLLSEAESTSIVHFHKGAGKPSSRAPKGAFRDRQPDPDEGLLTWFVFRLEKVRGDSQLAALCAEGEVRLAKRLKRQPGREAGSGYEGARESAEERDRRIVESYEGLDPAEVRVIESERSGFVSEANIRLVRIRAKKDPVTGRDAPEAPESFAAKKKMALELHEQGLSVRAIAGRVMAARQTVTNWVAKEGSNGEDKAA